MDKKFSVAALVLATAMMWNEKASAKDSVKLVEMKPGSSQQQSLNKVVVQDDGSFATEGFDSESTGANFKGKLKLAPDNYTILYGGYTENGAEGSPEEMNNRILGVGITDVKSQMIAAQNGNGNVVNSIIDVGGEAIHGAKWTYAAIAGKSYNGYMKNNRVMGSNLASVGNDLGLNASAQPRDTVIAGAESNRLENMDDSLGDLRTNLNSVELTGVQLDGLAIKDRTRIAGAINANDEAVGNSVILNNVKTINIKNEGTKYGIFGAQAVGDVTGNTVEINGYDKGTMEIKDGQIYGGLNSAQPLDYTTYGPNAGTQVDGNVVTINNVQKMGSRVLIYGGCTDSKGAQITENAVSILGTEKNPVEIGAELFGGYGWGSGHIVKGNSVEFGSLGTSMQLKGGDSSDIVGGFASVSLGKLNKAEENEVSLHSKNKANIIIKDQITISGAKAQIVQGNKVNFENIVGEIRDKAKIIGGNVLGFGGSARDNSVMIKAGEGNFSIYGEAGIYGAKGTARAINNSVTIDKLHYMNDNASIVGAEADIPTGTQLIKGNHVTLTNLKKDSTYIGGVFGAKSLNSADVEENVVDISADAGASLGFKVYGGHIRDGLAATRVINQAVNISAESDADGGSVSTIDSWAKIYGAYGNNAKVKSNHVTIENFPVIEEGSEIYGAYAKSTNISESYEDNINNTVTIITKDKGQGIQLLGKVYGAYAESTSNGNEVVVGNITTIGKRAELYGGYSETNGASYNSVKLSGKTSLGTAGKIYGGYTEDGSSASRNHISMANVALMKGKIYGGFVENDEAGIAQANNIDVNAMETSALASIEGTISGGYALGKAIENNVVLARVNKIAKRAKVYGAGEGFDSQEASKNTLQIIMSGSDRVIDGTVHAAQALEIANNNKLEISGAKAINRDLYAIETEGKASQNIVKIIGDTNEDEAVTMAGEVCAAVGDTEINSNELSIKNFKRVEGDVVAGRSRKGTANENKLILQGIVGSEKYSTVEGEIYGGYGRTSASGNEIRLANIKANNSIVGGRTLEGKAQDNRIYISGDNDLERAYIMGGSTNGNFQAEDSGEAYRKGNQLFIGTDGVGNLAAFDSANAKGNVVRGLQNFEEIIFNEVIAKPNHPALKILEQSDLSKTKVNADGLAFATLPEYKDFIKEGAKVILIDTNSHDMEIKEENVISDGNYTVGTTLTGNDGKAKLEGHNVIYVIGKTDEGSGGESGGSGSGGESGGSGSGGESGGSGGESGDSEVTPTPKPDPEKPTPTLFTQAQTHNVVIGHTAALASVNAGQNFVERALSGGLEQQQYGPQVYFATSGGYDKYKTGSHIKTNVWNANLSIVNTVELASGGLSYLAGFEYGTGSYDVKGDGINGDGDINYQGLTLGTKYLHNSGFYTEGAARIGHVKNTANNVLIDGHGNAYSYETSGYYAGGHLGFGYILNLNENLNLDIYSKYSYMNIEKDKFNAGGEYKLDAVESSIAKAGFRLNQAYNNWNFAYGLGIEHQFDGEAKGTADGYAIKSADIGGTNGIVEFSATLKPSAESPWRFNFGVDGYIGRHQGVRGNLGLSYKF